MSSVYLAQHVESKRLYVGKARYPDKRRKRHVNDAMRHKSETYFHRAIRTHGPDAFIWITLETFETDQEAMEAEAFWIGYFRSLNAELYNISSGGDGFSHGEETKRKISTYQKGLRKSEDHKKRISESNKGVPRPALTPEAQEGRARGGRIASANNVGKKRSAETRLKLSLSHKKPWSEKRRAAFENSKKPAGAE